MCSLDRLALFIDTHHFGGSGMIVLLTIHGIGFQQAPSGLFATDGYADPLHERLRSQLGSALGDDPLRVAVNGSGPVYVQSSYPAHTTATEPGVARLGSWEPGGTVNATNEPLAAAGSAIAHVALVYAGLEENSGDIAALLGLETLSAASITDYASLGGLAKMVVRDLEALRVHPEGDGSPSPSLRPRTDTTMHRGLARRLLDRVGKPSSQIKPTGPAGILHTVEDDVAAYVTRNEHRERVRSFIRDSASRIIARPDVAGLVINGHSNGTVMGFDVLAAMSPPAAAKVRALITSGSPLRKYADLLDWGRDAGSARLMRDQWVNFWDPLDPVADPLSPPFGWKRTQQVPPSNDGSMFVVHDPTTGDERNLPISDMQVDNVHDSQGMGLRAHNYWDNDAFASGAAAILRQAVLTT
jgi:hypothetical protein